MPVQELLLLAVTRMLGGVCVAGMTADPDPLTGLRWVRPVREHGQVLLGDITTAQGSVLRPFDVAALHFLRPRPQPPHAEDWTVDWRQRPVVVRRLEGERRRAFLAKYLDADPCHVLDNQERSLCLVRPDRVAGCFSLDAYTGKLEARLSFVVAGRPYHGSFAQGGLPVTDLKWRALGRAWLPPEGGWLDFDEGDLEARLGVREVFLAVGLGRSFQGACHTLVVGVHTVPEYEVVVDYDNL